ncbi:MAG: helix-turn-helix transcriptional regulator [Phycisphaerae bacterium]
MTLLITTEELCELLRLSKSMFYQLKATGKIGVRALAVGKKSLYYLEEVKEYIAKSAERGSLFTYDEWQEMRRSENGC